MTTIFGKPWSETLSGSNDTDMIFGDGGDDTIFGNDGADHLYGDAGQDTLIGGSGDDRLTGGLGGDHLSGGIGSDTASYASSTAGVTVNLGGGYAHGGDADGDVLYSIENLDGSNFEDNLFGGSGANVLNGLYGDDWLYGMGGNDQLVGGSGADHLFGGEGFDVIDGGLGQDFLAGGASRDIFVFNKVGDSGAGISSRDTIMDFRASTGSMYDFMLADKIDLSGIDALQAPGDQSFNLVEGGFTGAGQVRVSQENGNTYVQANLDGDTTPEFEIELIGLHALSASDFIL